MRPIAVLAVTGIVLVAVGLVLAGGDLVRAASPFEEELQRTANRLIANAVAFAELSDTDLAVRHAL